MIFKLPSLHKTYKGFGSRNIINHLIHKEIEVDSAYLIQQGRFLKIKFGDDWIYFTRSTNNLTAQMTHVVKCDKAPTVERIETEELRLNWFKHPQLRDYQPSEIVDSWKGDFTIKEEHKDETTQINGLRDPQIGSIYATLAHWRSSDETGTVVLPTGTGKTETMLSLLVLRQCPKLLIIVPSDSLRDQLSKKFYSLGLLRKLELITEQSLFPRVGVLKSKISDDDLFREFLNGCNVVVTTMDIASGCSEVQQSIMVDHFSHLFIDEAHHIKAKTWSSFTERFPHKSILQFTATPFRNDQKRIGGKIIFNFPLKKAQDQGYFKKINFVSIRQYDMEKADHELAEISVAKLREDLETYNHILMARCKNHKEADRIFEIYRVHEDLNPVCIHSGRSDKKEVMGKILSKTAKIIVCVDMLGEGFDLPELKIAAFHFIRKSLPITLQLAGRFTRTDFDDTLGEATIFANVADVNVRDELDDLYAQDADWNQLLPTLSQAQIEEEQQLTDYFAGFNKIDQSKVPFQNMRPALSTVAYRNTENADWNPKNFRAGLNEIGTNEYLFSDYNSNQKVLVIITGRQKDIDWGVSKDIFDIHWEMIIVHWDSRENILLIHGSDNAGLYKDLAESVLDENIQIVNKMDVYKAFHGLNRVKLHNVGLKKFLGKNIRFQMLFGADIQAAISATAESGAQKTIVQGIGYENGVKVSLGCSAKGRIWSKMRGNVKQFTDWSKKIAAKINDPDIDPNTILRNTLIPKLIDQRPNAYPVFLDWHEDMYIQSETKFTFHINGRFYDLASCELKVVNPDNNNELRFSLKTEDSEIVFQLNLFSEDHDLGGGNIQSIPDFKIEKISTDEVSVSFGSKTMSLEDFFNLFIPTIWFADGSALTGTEYIELKSGSVGLYPIEKIVSWDWTEVDISKEAQGVPPKITNSIQYKVIEKLVAEDYDIVYDDDYSGEIADIVAIKDNGDKLIIELYHLKYAVNGRVSGQIKNFYEVCGQVQKSIQWKHRKGREFFSHLLRRETKTKNGVSCSRIEKGTRAEIARLERLAKEEIPMEFKIYLVQPGASKRNLSDDILSLLGVTENYLMEIAAIELEVITSA